MYPYQRFLGFPTPSSTKSAWNTKGPGHSSFQPQLHLNVRRLRAHREPHLPGSERGACLNTCEVSTHVHSLLARCGVDRRRNEGQRDQFPHPTWTILESAAALAPRLCGIASVWAPCMREHLVSARSLFGYYLLSLLAWAPLKWDSQKRAPLMLLYIWQMCQKLHFS